MMERETLLRIEHLKKEYPGVTPLRDVNLDVRKGDVIAIIGPSGTGKSTLLRMINRLTDATSGSIVCEGVDVLALKGRRVREWRARCAMVLNCSASTTRSSAATAASVCSALSATLVMALRTLEMASAGDP